MLSCKGPGQGRQVVQVCYMYVTISCALTHLIILVLRNIAWVLSSPIIVNEFIVKFCITLCYCCLLKEWLAILLSVAILALVHPAMVTVISDDVDAVYQDNVTLTCTAFGSSVMVTWSTTADVSLPYATTVSTGKNEYQNSLMLMSVSLQATGVYTCNAKNQFGNDSAALNVTVTGLYHVYVP